MLNFILTGPTSSNSVGINNKIGKIIDLVYGQYWLCLELEQDIEAGLKFLQRCCALCLPAQTHPNPPKMWNPWRITMITAVSVVTPKFWDEPKALKNLGEE